MMGRREGGGVYSNAASGAKIAAESHLLSLADYALAAHFPFTVHCEFTVPGALLHISA